MLLELEDQETLVKNVDLTFIPTGSEFLDRQLSGIINDSPLFVKEAMRHRMWKTINQSKTPYIDAERFAMMLCGVKTRVDETIKSLRKILLPHYMNVLQAYEKQDIQPKNNLGRKLLTYVKLTQNDVKTTQNDVETIEIVYHPRKKSLENKVTGQEYTFGRGRRPEWVQTWIQTHGNPLDNSK